MINGSNKQIRGGVVSTQLQQGGSNRYTRLREAKKIKEPYPHEK